MCCCGVCIISRGDIIASMGVLRMAGEWAPGGGGAAPPPAAAADADGIAPAAAAPPTGVPAVSEPPERIHLPFLETVI